MTKVNIVWTLDTEYPCVIVHTPKEADALRMFEDWFQGNLTPIFIRTKDESKIFELIHPEERGFIPELIKIEGELRMRDPLKLESLVKKIGKDMP